MKAAILLCVCALSLQARFSACQPLVIQHSKVPNSNLANFVLTVNDTDPRLADVSHGGAVGNAQGFDIVFSSDNQGRQLLAWDPLEVYDPATGRIVAHVQVGTVSSVTDTVIYRCAGNPAATSFQGGARGSAWPANYEGIWHLSETSGAQRDSTINGNDSSTVTIASEGLGSGQIGGADMATGGNDNIGIPGAGFSLPGGYTISGWIKSNSWGTGYRAVARVDGSINPAGLYVYNGKVLFYYSGDAAIGSTSLQNGIWYYIAVAVNGPGQAATLYINGAVDGTGNILFSNLGAVNSVHLCGDSFSQAVNGVCDEMRIANTVLSADRIAADYNNQSSPTTFYRPGGWTSLQGTTSQVSIF